MKKKFIIICFMVASLFSNCQYPIRKPIVQGTFYPASATELKKKSKVGIKHINLRNT